jgi:hypothetical protein
MDKNAIASQMTEALLIAKLARDNSDLEPAYAPEAEGIIITILAVKIFDELKVK